MVQVGGGGGRPGGHGVVVVVHRRVGGVWGVRVGVVVVVGCGRVEVGRVEGPAASRGPGAAVRCARHVEG